MRVKSLIDRCEAGESICLIGKNMENTSRIIGKGSLFTRCHMRSALLLIRVDTVIYVTEPPDWIRQLGANLLRISLHPTVIHYYNPPWLYRLQYLLDELK